MECCGGLLRLELRSPRKCEPKWRTILHPIHSYSSFWCLSKQTGAYTLVRHVHAEEAKVRGGGSLNSRT